MKSIIRTLVGLFFFCCLSAEAFAKNELSGEWEGQYLCAQGLTNFTLSLSPVVGSNSVFEGTFFFFPHHSNPHVPNGKYTIKSTLMDNNGRFEINPVTWVNQPNGYIFAQMYGSLIQDGKAMKGMVNLEGCKSFFAKNINAENVDEVGGVPREAQSQMLIDRVQHEFENKTRNRTFSSIKNQPTVSNKDQHSKTEPFKSSRTGFFKYEVKSGFNTICFYDVLGDVMAHNIGGAGICPLSHTF